MSDSLVIEDKATVDETPSTGGEKKEDMAAIFFEDDEEILLRDGRKYKIQPSSLKNARKMMELLKTVSTDIIILNYLPGKGEPTGDESEDTADNLVQLLMMAFENYEHVDEEYINRYVDIITAQKIIEIMMGLNGLKKSMGS